ncbi:MAG: PPA1309 family protein [Gordonia sp. (in: high G+C Gram-positive bacteria)]|uniref:PPA1309 family protein n=1 Tax=Gordonia sp. (in: high G+C Gram-positive bacteria) TaxID=84139 RepID=UPI0039E4B15B
MTDADLSPDALGAALRDVTEFVDTSGWGQAPMLFALVPTGVLAQTDPDLVDEFDDSELSPIAQEQLPLSDDPTTVDDELEHVLGTTRWPEAVAGCALVQEIIVLPPQAEGDLDDAFEPLLADPDAAEAAAREAAQAHPDQKEARLIAGVLRDGRRLALLQLRDDEDEDGRIELLSHPDLAPGLLDALEATLDAEDY